MVDAGGGGDFTSLQAAIDAAADGDILLVRSGTYGGFDIDHKGLTIVADRQASASVARLSTVHDLDTSQTVVLSGLLIDHGGSEGADALRLQDCDGAVRVHECVLLGYDGLPGDHDAGKFPEGAGRAAFSLRCADVAFSACELRGGEGGDSPDECQGCVLPAGAAGLEGQQSSLALYRTLLFGGDGGEDFCCGCGGSGGSGADVIGGSFFAVHSVFQGGDGKDGNDVIPCCGEGGAGLVIATTGAAEFSSFFYGGDRGCFVYGGTPQCEWCSDGAGVVGSIQSFNGQPRAALMPRVVREGESYTIDYYGNPGDVVQQLASTLAGFDFRVPWRGVLLIAPPLAVGPPVGTIPAGGVLSITKVEGNLPALLEGRLIHRQALLGAPMGARFLSNPTPYVVLDSSF